MNPQNYIIPSFLLSCLLSSQSIKASEILSKKLKYPPDKKPVEIDINIQINKIYRINSMDETYQIDGYLVAGWNYQPEFAPKEQIIYENQVADQMVGTQVWAPAFEFINVVENRQIGNKQILIGTTGMVEYSERFNAIFTLPMNFKFFPFDRQKFSIQLEAFSYAIDQVTFTSNRTEIIQIDEEMTDEWIVQKSNLSIQDIKYFHLDSGPEPLVFSRYVIEITAQRKVNRYLWQLILPLMLIVSVSWAIFWINDVSNQLTTGFTLMLTLVAFNFHTSSMLPSLPYITLIEFLITIGYLSLFIVLLVIIFGNAVIANSSPEKYKKIIIRCRYIVPVSFLIILLIMTLWVFTN